MPSASVALAAFTDTECYATDIEQSAPTGVMTNPLDHIGVYITAVILFVNVILRLWPARILLVESMQFSKMALGVP